MVLTAFHTFLFLYTSLPTDSQLFQLWENRNRSAQITEICKCIFIRFNQFWIHSKLLFLLFCVRKNSFQACKGKEKNPCSDVCNFQLLLFRVGRQRARRCKELWTTCLDKRGNLSITWHLRCRGIRLYESIMWKAFFTSSAYSYNEAPASIQQNHFQQSSGACSSVPVLSGLWVCFDGG